MHIKATIFDLDGTLLDTLEDLAASFNRVLSKNRFPIHKPEEYRNFVGNGALTCLTRILPQDHRFRARDIEKLLQEFKWDYNQNWNKTTKPYPAIPELLDALVKSNIRLAVLSNKPHDITLKCVNYYFKQNPFSIILGQSEQIPVKPNPTGVLHIIDQLGILPSETLLIGDTSTDMVTARNAGLTPIGVAWGFRTITELQESGASRIIHDPLDLLEIIENQ